MLKGIPKILPPELLKVLCEMGHSDRICIADGNFPSESIEKVDIRVGTVLECTKVPKADKLLQFKIDDGLETRTILSGIAKQFKPEELVGKQVCFIANLAPRTLRGIVSQGMILSAEDNEGKLSLLTVTPKAKPGSEIK